jgi:peptidoglycan/LPS O-acetylase OafA/YrhL
MVRFEPLRPASRRVRIAAVIAGPLLWLAALIVAAWVLKYTAAIELGLLITVASFLVSLLVLLLIHAARRRQERRYVERG